MKKHLITIVMAIVFLVGLSVLLYPTVSSYINARSQSRVIARYYEDLAYIDQKDYSELLESAREYNRRLLTKKNRFLLSDEEMTEYFSMLDFTGRGILGTLEINSIDVKLPIYHGTDEAVLQIGVGHLPGSSLPAGGLGTHAAISGHRGLPSATLLTHLNKLAIGDTFVLRILNEVLTYEVDQILTVEPDDMNALGIEAEMDYCTLITCTPYGINSHRLLVRGHRAANGEIAAAVEIHADAEIINSKWVSFIVILPALAVIAVSALKKYRKIMKGGKNQ